MMVIFFRANTIHGYDRFKATKMNATATQYPKIFFKNEFFVFNIRMKCITVWNDKQLRYYCFPLGGGISYVSFQMKED